MSLRIGDLLIPNVRIFQSTGTGAGSYQSKTVTPTSSQQIITAASGYDALSSVTVNAVPAETGSFTNNGTYTPTSGHWFSSVTINVPTGSTISNQNKTVTPTELTQLVSADSGYSGLGTVTVNGIPANYIGSGIVHKTSFDLSLSGTTVTAPAGYYENDGVFVVPTETETITSNGTYTPTAGSLYSSVTVSVPTSSAINNQDKTINPTESSQIVTYDSGYTGLETVTVGAISPTYVGSGITRRNATNLSASGATVSVPAGYYENAATKSVTTTTHPNPVISFDSSTGLITVTHTQTAGYVDADTLIVTQQLTTQAATAITPDTTTQTAVAANTYTLGAVTVNPIPSNYIIPSGSQTVTSNDTYDVTDLAELVVNVPVGSTINNQNKTVTPTESQQSIQADSGYTGLGTVTVNAISNLYVGSGIIQRTSADLTVNGATITAPTGYYASSASKSVATMTLPTAATSSATSGYTSKATISRSTSDQYINIPTGYNATGSYYKINKVPNAILEYSDLMLDRSETRVGSTNGTLTLLGSGELIKTNASTSGYLDVNDVSNISVSVYAYSNIPYYSNSNNNIAISNLTVTIPTGYYSGTTTKTLTDDNLIAGNIKSGITIFGITGSYSGAAINNQNKTVTPSESQQTINADSDYTGLGTVTVEAIPIISSYTVSNANASFYTENGTRKWRIQPNITSSEDGYLHFQRYLSITGNYSTYRALASNTIITPTETQQTVGGSDWMMEGAITISAIPSNYIGSGVTQRDSTDLTASGATVTVPAGYYATNATKSITTSTITNTVINGSATLEDTNDYAFDVTVTIPAGYYAATTLTKSFSSILPAPETEGTASQVLVGYDLYNHDGQLITGSMANNGSWNRALDDSTTSVTIPAGYHNGSGTISHTTVNIPDPTISVNSSTGVITASGNWTKGFTTDNSYSKTYNLTTQAATTATPTESEQTIVTAGKYTLGAIKVAAISSTYVGSGITQRSSTDLTVSGAMVTAPAGYYATAASKSVASGSATGPTSLSGTGASITTGTNTITFTKTGITTTPTVVAGYVASATASTATVSLTANITPRTSSSVTASGATVTIPAGYYASQVTKTISSGTATNSGSASGTSATLSTGTNTLTLTKSVSITPTVTAGYISTGTAGNVSISLTASVTTKAAATITPGISNQTIASGTYLTGTQTIAGDADLVAGNIKSGVNIFGVTGNYSGLDTSDATATAADIIEDETAYVDGRKLTGTLVVQTYYTGSTAPSSSLGRDGDIYLRS